MFVSGHIGAIGAGHLRGILALLPIFADRAEMAKIQVIDMLWHECLAWVMQRYGCGPQFRLFQYWRF